MQAISPSRARTMFEAMAFPTLEPLTCDDNWIYDPGPFYSALAEVAENDFTPSEITAGKRLAFLLPYVTRLNSHGQVIPVAHLLTTAKLTSEEVRQLSPPYAEALLSVPADPLTFAAIAEDGGDYVKSVYGSDSLSAAMSAVVSTMQKSDIAPALLLRPLRSYLVQNFNGSRCDPKKPEEAANKKGSLPMAVASFNQTFDALLKRNAIAPISLSELPKAAVLPTTIWNPPNDAPPEEQQLLRTIQQLHSSLDHSTKNGQVDSSWWRELDDFLSRFYAWGQGSEPEGDYVAAKADFYQSLVTFVPKSPQQQEVLESFVDFLGQHSYQSLGGAGWLINCKLFLLNFSARGSHSEIISAFLNSCDPVLSLYARLEVWNGKAVGPHWPAAS